VAKSTFVYVTYIRTTPEQLWSALTDAEFTKQYWFGMHCQSQWTAGSSWKLVSGDGQIYDSGEIVESDPPRRLVIRWQNQHKPELKAEGESLCTKVISNLKSLLETGSPALQEPYPVEGAHAGKD